MLKILDCTLRDGGYINNWNFKQKNIVKILKALTCANIDIVEIGYLDDKRGSSKDSTIFDSLKSIEHILTLVKFDVNIEKVVMINLGDFSIDKLVEKNKTSIDGIRLAFHKEDLESAFHTAHKIKKLGYKLYFQPMLTKNYSDEEFLDIVKKVNTIQPHVFYIVDSFGSMTLKEFHKYLVLTDGNLEENISVGYHSHNNMQLAFSNAISMSAQNLKREIIIDSSIYGMGRGAGNLNTELILDYLNSTYDANYDTLPILEIIDELLINLMEKNSWGFSPAHFLSASYNCHPNYATYLVNKNTNHIVSIKKILDKLPENKKISFDKEFAEKIYRDHILEPKSKLQGNFHLSHHKKLLFIASGKSINEYKNILTSKANDLSYEVVALNHIPDIDCNYYFFTNQKRYDEFQGKLRTRNIVVTNNIKVNNNPFAVLDFAKLVLSEDELVTNSTILAINFLVQTGHKEVEVAGLDGYQIGGENYSYDENQIVIDKQSQKKQNILIEKSLKKLFEKINIKLITPSIFNLK